MQQQPQMRIGSPLTPAVKWIIIINTAIWILTALLGPVWFNLEEVLPFISHHLLLHPGWHDGDSVLRGDVWQVFTYMWLHADFMHLLFNMFILWMFGGLFEQRWGTSAFLGFYIRCGIGGAVVSILAALISPRLFGTPILGASGAILGLIAAFGAVYPREKIYLFFVLPVEGRHIITITAVIDLLMFIGNPHGFAFATHMGGLLSGYLLVTGLWRRIPVIGMLLAWLERLIGWGALQADKLKLRWLRWKRDRPARNVRQQRQQRIKKQTHLRSITEDDDEPWIN